MVHAEPFHPSFHSAMFYLSAPSQLCLFTKLSKSEPLITLCNSTSCTLQLLCVNISASTSFMDLELWELLCIVLFYLHAKFCEQIRDMAKIWLNDEKKYLLILVVAMLLLEHHSNSPIFVAVITISMVMVIMLLWLWACTVITLCNSSHFHYK